MNQTATSDRYPLMFINACDAMLLLDHSGALLLVNPAAGRLFGRDPEELTGKALFSLLDDRPLEAPSGHTTDLASLLVHLMENENLAVAHERARGLNRFLDVQGKTFVGEWCCSCFLDSEAAVLILLQIRDVSEIMACQQRLIDAEAAATRAAIHDDLTGLYNRRGFLEFLHHELERAKRTGAPMGLIMIDIDRFKQVNDRFGHTGGDWLLKTFSERLSVSLRDYDLLARFAGDEFILLLPETDPEEALQIAERLRVKAASEGFLYNGIPFTVTISLGVISVPATYTGEADALIAQVDQALYQAKTKRDEVCFLELK